MNKLTISTLGIGTLLVSANCTAPDNEIARPNIILIMTDDMGVEALGCYGGLSYDTPVLDRLASEGIRFTNSYSQSLCTPSRVKIMTGKYNFRNYEHFGYLNPNQETFGNYLKGAGYETAIAGKWQLNGLNRNNIGNQDTTRPYHFGFDEYCLWQLHRPTSAGERYADPLIYQNGKKLDGLEDSYGPDVFLNFITDFIDRNSGKPFFIYYPMVLPHSPFVPTPNSAAWDDRSTRNDNDDRYFKDMVEYVDVIVGRIENNLKDKGLWENTLLLFTSDNGTHRRIVSETVAGDITGAKGLSINAGNHVPLIAVWPSVISGGRIYDGIVSFADFLPTLTDIAGIEPCFVRTDGRSFLPVLEGSDLPIQDEIFMHYSPRWGPGAGWHNTRWVMDGNYKLYRDIGFFNTEADPLEESPLTNMSPNERNTRDRFESILDEMELEFPFHLNDAPHIPQY
jgi:arylsulfatase A